MLLPDELKLISYYDTIEIIPKSFIPTLYLLEQELGPFHIHKIYKIPIFIALKLQSMNLIFIKIPSFYKKENLIKNINDEKKIESYSLINPNLFNLSIFCKYKKKLDELKSLRREKTLRGMKSLDGKAVNVNCLSVFEFMEVKELLIGGMEACIRLEK